MKTMTQMKNVTAYILVMTKVGKERETMHHLMKLDQVREARNVYGDYDVIVKVEAESIDQLNSFVFEKIRKIETVASSNTLLALNAQ